MIFPLSTFVYKSVSNNTPRNFANLMFQGFKISKELSHGPSVHKVNHIKSKTHGLTTKKASIIKINDFC